MALMVSTALLDLQRKPHVLYRFFDRTDTLLYVGITADMGKRLDQHKRDKAWWPVVENIKLEHFGNRQDALDAERAAIKTEKPLYNEQHNDLVEAPMADDGADEVDELACSILGHLDDEERDALLEENRYGYDDELLDDRGQRRAAAEGALTTFFWDRHRLHRALLNVFEYLPDEQWERCYEAALKEIEGGQRQTPFRVVIATAKVLHTELAEAHLATLSDEERDEWLACARTIRPAGDESELIRFAGDYSRFWRREHGPWPGSCSGAGEHGARCPKPAPFAVWLEGCKSCEEEGSKGHACCESHRDGALAGLIRANTGMQVKAVRWAERNSNDWMPF